VSIPLLTTNYYPKLNIYQYIQILSLFPCDRLEKDQMDDNLEKDGYYTSPE
jgi:hypothetical protein